MSLLDLRDAIVDQVKATFPELRECSGHAGRFDLEELKRFLLSAPAVRVAVVSVRNIEGTGTGQARGDADMAAFIVTRDTSKLPKEDAAMAMADSLAPLVVENDWGLAGAGAARDVKAQNLYSAAIDRTGVALWAVSWSQQVELGTLVGEDGVVPTAIYASMAPDIGLEHKGDYRDVSTGEAPPDA